MIEKGYLNTTGDPQLGFYYRFDNCGRTVSPRLSSEDGLALIPGAAVCVQSHHRDRGCLREQRFVRCQRRVHSEAEPEGICHVGSWR